MGDEDIEVFILEVYDEDLQELRTEGHLRFSFEGDIIERDPVIDIEYKR